MKNNQKHLFYKAIIAVAILTLLVSMTVLVGWAIDIEMILSVVPGSSPMKVNTALAFFFSSIALILTQVQPKMNKLVAGSIITPSVFIGVYTLLQYLLKPTFIIDNLFIFDHYQIRYPGRMSPATAICHIIIATSVMGSVAKKNIIRQITQHLLLCCSIISLIAISAYILLIPSENKFFFINSMAIHTSVLFFLLSLTISLKNKSIGFIGLICGEYAGSRLIRTFIPFTILLPITLSFILLLLTSHQYLEHDFGVALYTVIFITSSSIYISLVAIRLNKTDKKRKKLEHSLRSMLKEKERFVYIASHDLQEPLRTVSNFSLSLSTKYKNHLDDQGKKSLYFIVEATKRMSELIKGLLDYSRIETNRKTNFVDINKIIKDISADIQQIIKETNTKIDTTLLPTIQGNDTELRLLFQNIILNAIKFRKKDEPPIINISCIKEEMHWTFSVTDNGIGMDPKYFKKIFIIFQRLHTLKKYPGTGIGLAHCAKIVEVHGGKIWVDSIPGVGSTFHFTIST